MAEGSLTDHAFIDRYRQCFDRTWRDDSAVGAVRFVVLDCKTTGLNPAVDSIITIGAIGVQDGAILIEDSFDALIRIERNTSAVTVHGITRDESRNGLDEPQALGKFLDYLKDGVIVGHHIGHDIASLDAGYERHWGFRLANRWLDTMYLSAHLAKAGAFSSRHTAREFTLDVLCDVFGIEPHGRHTASGDAFLTAQVFLRLCLFARRNGRTTLGQICEPFQFEEA